MQQSTKMSKLTDDTFSDRVQKNIKDNGSNPRSAIASKESNRAAVKVQESSPTHDAQNQNWVNYLHRGINE